MSHTQFSQFSTNKSVSKQLKVKSVEFLSSQKYANNLIEILDYFKECFHKNTSITPCLLALETIFVEVLRRSDMLVDIEPLKPLKETPEKRHKEWLQAQYKEAFSLIIEGINYDKNAESTQALSTAMKILSFEGKFPIENGSSFPINKLRRIVATMLSPDKLNSHLFNRFLEYSSHLDILFYCWKILPAITPKEQSPNSIFIQNFLDFISAVTITKEIQQNQMFLCKEIDFDYQIVRKNMNKTWACVMLWNHDEVTHRQLLVLLLEKVLTHLDKPVLLTDFLMDSLDNGGAISLLALQGIFILIQQHNLSYPNIYEKLYSMFEPEIFHTKFKARLFYLADIFLSSSHLPEGLVAAFVKRLSRLAMIAPPQDIVIILHFIGNLILRHPALKRLIFHPNGGEVSQDPFIMEERDPTKSNALDSSLWEIVGLQTHALPSVATVAKFISNPLPSVEWDLSKILEINENDIFDKEIAKKTKEYALTFERPMSMFLYCGDKTSQYWKLF